MTPIEDSGVGGTSAGIYDLRLTFRPGAVRSITDADNSSLDGTPIDGDLDGVPGGIYNFWFRVAAPKGQEQSERSADDFRGQGRRGRWNAGQPLRGPADGHG